MIKHLGEPSFDGLIEALSSSAPSVALRVNPAKGLHPAHGSRLVPWCPAGVTLDSRPDFTFDPLMHQGAYYVQDASSMFISHVLRHIAADPQPRLYLDACAAPGGKTTAAADALPNGSLVVANEFVPQRAAILAENVAKWGNPLIAVTSGDTARFTTLTDTFDIIAADVPCSGEGMMRKDPEAMQQWSPELVARCAATQRQIIDNLWPALKPGGYLIYSTCTFNTTENEDQLRYMARTYGAVPVDIPTDTRAWHIVRGIATDMPCYRFIPGVVEGEGLFMAVMRKPLGDSDSGTCRSHKPSGDKKSGKRSRQSPKDTVPQHLRSWVETPTPLTWHLSAQGNVIATLHPSVAPDGFPFLPTLQVATMRGRDAIPSQQLALSTILADDAFPSVDIDTPQAISYLSAQAITLPDDTPRGLVLLRHAGLPLGFVKNIGSRANNLYPRQWRILSSPPPQPSLPEFAR